MAEIDWKRRYEIKAAHAETWQPCPGHRGKIDTRRDGCPWCEIERLRGKLGSIRYYTERAVAHGYNLDPEQVFPHLMPSETLSRNAASDRSDAKASR